MFLASSDAHRGASIERVLGQVNEIDPNQTPNPF